MNSIKCIGSCLFGGLAANLDWTQSSHRWCSLRFWLCVMSRKHWRHKEALEALGSPPAAASESEVKSSSVCSSLWSIPLKFTCKIDKSGLVQESKSLLVQSSTWSSKMGHLPSVGFRTDLGCYYWYQHNIDCPTQSGSNPHCTAGLGALAKPHLNLNLRWGSGSA